MAAAAAEGGGRGRVGYRSVGGQRGRALRVRFADCWVLTAVNESWDVIVDWLGRHSPSELALVRPPAAEDDIREAERSVGAALPEDLVAWWRRADGQAGQGQFAAAFYSPYSVRMALRSREVWMMAWNGVMEQASADQFAAYMAQADRAPAGSPCKGAWLPRWLPIAGDGGGNDLFVDLRPGASHGCVWQFLREDGAGDGPWWDGVAAMLAEVAAGPTQDVRVRGLRIWVEDDGGCLCGDPRAAVLEPTRYGYTDAHACFPYLMSTILGNSSPAASIEASRSSSLDSGCATRCSVWHRSWRGPECWAEASAGPPSPSPCRPAPHEPDPGPACAFRSSIAEVWSTSGSHVFGPVAASDPAGTPSRSTTTCLASWTRRTWRRAMPTTSSPTLRTPRSPG